MTLLPTVLMTCLVVGHGNVITLMMHHGSIYALYEVDDYYLAYVMLPSLIWFRNTKKRKAPQ